ncbi:MAG: methionyl-tRNA formyltransferase [Candidatus Saccharimonadales bacterium]
MPSSGDKSSVVFFGSGPVAAKSLELLLKHQEVEAIVTKPATKNHMQSIASDIPVYAVGNKAELDGLIVSALFSSNLGVLIDFGIIVSQTVIDSFTHGIINSHFSLLPEWRGADPINFSILSGQAKTGVSLMLVDKGMDTGKILTQKTLILKQDETSTTLTQKLIALSGDLLCVSIPRYLKGEIKPKNQPHPDRATYSRKLAKKDGSLDFTKPAKILEREIRAFIEWPKSRTTLAGKDVVILKASLDDTASGQIGEAYVTDDKKIGIYTTAGSLIIEDLKPANKNPMSSKAFLAGYGHNL